MEANMGDGMDSLLGYMRRQQYKLDNSGYKEMKRNKDNDKLVEQVVERAKREPKKKGSSIFAPTGSTKLDLIVGGGYPFGKIVNVVGDTSSGKTYFALECITSSVKKYGKKLKWFYDNTESGFSFDTKSMYDLEILTDDMKQRRSETVEEMCANLKKELSNVKEDEYLIYVVDSLDGLNCDAEIERDKKRQKAIEKGEKYEQGTYGMNKQKFMSEFFRLRASEIEDKNCLLLIISQVRHNIGVMFGEKYVRSGGKALDFYSHICLWLAVSEKHKKKDRTIGITIKAKTKKAKIKHPFREGYIDLIFDYGIDDVGSNIKYLYDLRTDTGKNKKNIEKIKLEWDGEEYTFDELIDYVESNDLETILEQRVIDKWMDIEDSIATKGRKDKWK